MVIKAIMMGLAAWYEWRKKKEREEGVLG